MEKTFTSVKFNFVGVPTKMRDLTYPRKILTHTGDEDHIRKRLEGVQTDRLKRTFKDTKLVFGKQQPMKLKCLLTSSAFSSLPAEHHTEGITH